MAVSAGHVDAVANAAKGLDDAGRERLGGLADALLSFARVEPVNVFERRCRLLGKRLAGDEGESELDKQKAAVSVRRWVDKPAGMHHTHLAFDPERDAKLWSAIDAQLATIKQTDGNSGTPIDRPVGRRSRVGGVRGTVRGAAGARDLRPRRLPNDAQRFARTLAV